MANIVKRNVADGGLTTLRPMSFGGLVDGVLQNAWNRFFDDDFWGAAPMAGGTNQVPVNIRETDKSYEVELVAPGLRKEDFKVHIHHNQLTISFEHQEEEENRQDEYLRREYRMQAFSRSFTLDDTVDVDHIAAQYRDGVLCLSLPKKEGAQRLTKEIPIS